MSFIVAIVAPVSAAQVLLDADSQRLQVGQSVGLHVTVVDGSSSRPELPEVEGLRFVPAGQQVGFQMLNFKNIKTVTYSWQLTAEQEGSFGIPSVPVEVDGTTLYSNPLRLSVSSREATEGEVIEATLSSGESTLWVGQTVVYDLRFATPKRMVDRRWTPPSFEGMVSEQGTERRVREYQAAIDGEPHEMIEVSEPLVITAAGRRNIAPSVFTVQYALRSGRQSRDPLGFGAFVETKTEVFTSEALPIDVLELPAEGRIDELWTGLVGDFSLTAELSEERVALGESATLEVVIVGDGSLAGFELPVLEERDGYRVYDDEAEVEAEIVEGRFLTKGVYRRAIVPESVGRIDIDPVELQVFDPSAGSYRLIRSEPAVLDVTEGEAVGTLESFSDGEVDARRDVKDLGEDILPIKTSPSGQSGVFSPWMFLWFGVIPGLAFCGVLGGSWLRSRSQLVDPRTELRRRLAALPDDLAEIEDVYRESLALHLGVSAAGIEKRDLAQLPAGLRERCESLYTELEAARYGGAGGDLRGRVVQICEELVP
ncbi:MAG TPA: BatD family protein [Myxococcota bacterium]|nr:BatD family protein [Myxococcota bacterium]